MGCDNSILGGDLWKHDDSSCAEGLSWYCILLLTLHKGLMEGVESRVGGEVEK